jgi:hypothetical protein
MRSPSFQTTSYKTTFYFLKTYARERCPRSIYGSNLVLLGAGHCHGPGSWSILLRITASIKPYFQNPSKYNFVSQNKNAFKHVCFIEADQQVLVLLWLREYRLRFIVCSNRSPTHLLVLTQLTRTIDGAQLRGWDGGLKLMPTGLRRHVPAALVCCTRHVAATEIRYPFAVDI